MDAGGYADEKFWRQPFVERGRELTWHDAIARFVDRTGRPGPASWEVGSFPDGAGDLPVSGVSWYEAAAYAEWAGKSLPTIFHWNRGGPHGGQLAHRPARQPGRQGAGARGQHEEREPVRRLRPRGQRARMGAQFQRPRRRALHPGRRLERSRLRVCRCLCATAVRPIGDQRVSLHPLSREGREPGRAAARHRQAIAGFPRREAGRRRGLRAVPAAIPLRQDPAGGRHRGGEEGAGRHSPEDHVQRGLRRRADDGIPVSAVHGYAAVPGRDRVSRIRCDRGRLERVRSNWAVWISCRGPGAP